MAEHLHLWRQAANASAEDATLASKTPRRISPVLVVVHPVDAVALRREHDGVDVDLPTVLVHQFEALRWCAVGKNVSASPEHLLQQLDVPELDDDVEIVVGTGLPRQGRVHGPATVEPDIDPGSLEAVDKVDHVVGGHLPARISSRSGETAHGAIVAESRGRGA